MNECEDCTLEFWSPLQRSWMQDGYLMSVFCCPRCHGQHYHDVDNEMNTKKEEEERNE